MGSEPKHVPLYPVNVVKRNDRYGFYVAKPVGKTNQRFSDDEKKSVASQPETTQEEKSRPPKPAIEYFCSGKLLFSNLGNVQSISSLLRFSSNLCSTVSLLFVKGKRVESAEDSNEILKEPPRRGGRKCLFCIGTFFDCSPFLGEKYSNTFPQTLFF